MGLGKALFSQDDSREIDSVLEALLSRARESWPTLYVSDADFLGYLKERLPAKEAEAVAALRAVNGPDLYLACACARGVPGALIQLERRHLVPLRAVLRRSLDANEAFIDDVEQEVRQKLFLASGDRPARILAYSGRGSLTSWLRSTAMRTALNMLPSSPVASLDELAHRAEPGEDPELALLKNNCRREFKAAFDAALAELDPGEIRWLRLSLVEGLSIDELAPMFGVSRATAARRVAVARKRLMGRTKELLGQKLGMSTQELHSVIGLVRSQLDLSLFRRLGTE